MFYYIFFFFQAEDGIRDYKVTGVQTCALPICQHHGQRPDLPAQRVEEDAQRFQGDGTEKNAVARLSEDHRRCALASVESEDRVPDAPGDLRAIGQDERSARMGLDSQALEGARRHDRVDGARVHEELHADRAAGPRGIGDSDRDVGESHADLQATVARGPTRRGPRGGAETQAVKPPSTTSAVPVVKPDSSEARNR